GRRLPQEREGEGGAQEHHVQPGLRMTYEDDAGRGRRQERLVPSQAPAGHHRQAIEKEGEEGGRARQGPAEPELEEPREAEGETPPERWSLRDPLPAQQ